MNGGILLLAILALTFVDAGSARVHLFKQGSRSMHKEWETHKEQYLLKFTESDEDMRYQYFVHNMQKIERINRKNLSYTCAPNQFAHWTHTEYLDFLGNHLSRNVAEINSQHDGHHEHLLGDVADIDWREKGLVTSVKNQGSCGSCFAFSAVGTLEGQYKRVTNKLVDISPQDIIDCSLSYGNEGCRGGWMEQSFLYVKDHGIEKLSDYPYVATVRKCVHNNSLSILKVANISKINRGDDRQLSEKVASVGPISIAFDASGFGFRFYRSGVYSSSFCSSSSLNHGMLVVGLGSSPSKHFIVKNSWGHRWGSNGFVLVARDRNMCGIATVASYATVTIV